MALIAEKLIHKIQSGNPSDLDDRLEQVFPRKSSVLGDGAEKRGKFQTSKLRPSSSSFGSVSQILFSMFKAGSGTSVDTSMGSSIVSSEWDMSKQSLLQHNQVSNKQKRKSLGAPPKLNRLVSVSSPNIDALSTKKLLMIFVIGGVTPMEIR